MGLPRGAGVWAVVAALAAGGGCTGSRPFHEPVVPVPAVPHERNKTTLDEYIVESPDLLQIDLIEAVPKPPYRVRPLDVLGVTVPGALPAHPIDGPVSVDPDGTILLNDRYGRVKVVGLTIEEAKAAIQKQVTELKDPRVIVTVLQGRGVQLVRGSHLVRPDGTVTLGVYGTVQVAGRPLREVKALVEAQLAQTLQSPEVVVTVAGYNSKVFYVVFDFGGSGQQLIRLPVTGNDTVLDAMAQVNGLTAVSDPRRVWVARSAGPGECDLILPVDWHAMTCRGRAETNYQLMPGDRIYVKAYPLVTADVTLARVLSPLERVFGFTLLGAGTYTQVKTAGTGTGTGIIR